MTKRNVGAAMLALGAAMAVAVPAFAARPFDGEWDVGISVDSGTCDAGYMLPIKVINGVVSYNGQINTQASGAISDAGKVNVRFVHDKDEVSASGQLSGKSGAGKWASKTLNCTGKWQANKRA